MVIDSSALVAILLGELETLPFTQASEVSISAANLLEAGMVIYGRKGDPGLQRLDQYVDEAEIVVPPVTMLQARLARQAFVEYGQGRHRAGLTFGDCFAYALAKSLHRPLLFKGDDFQHTDLELVLV